MQITHIERDILQVKTSNAASDFKFNLFERKHFTPIKYPTGFNTAGICYSDKTDIIVKEKPIQKLPSYSIGTWIPNALYGQLTYDMLNLMVTADHEIMFDRRAYGRRTVRGRKLLFRYLTNALKRKLPSLFHNKPF